MGLLGLGWAIMASTVLTTGKKVEEIDLVGLFPASEGMIVQYYGRIGSGKTYAATMDVLRDLSRGEVVYTNWKINYDGYDQRTNLLFQVLSLIWPFPLRFYYFPKDNLHHIDVDEHFLDRFETLTDCKVYLDEGHVAFDSYEMAKMSLRKRKSVLHTRHFNRSIYIISQRPTAVHVSMRANVNVFYKCRRLMSWPFLLFARTEYQDLTVGETVDEEQPLSTRWYFGKSRIFRAYDTKYLRGETPASQKVFFEAYDLSWKNRFVSMLAFLIGAFRLKPKSRVPLLGVKKEGATLKNNMYVPPDIVGEVSPVLLDLKRKMIERTTSF